MERTGGTAAAQRDLWGQRPRDWAELQEGQVRPLYESVLDALEVGSGTHLLDVGCGAGMFCRLAADRGATVAGLDATPELVEVARERTPGGDFRVGELEDLPFADGEFDLATGFNSFQFAASPAQALREARRVVHSGGTVVMAIWGTPEQCEAAAILKAIGGLMPPPLPGAPGPFALSAPGALEALVESAGLKVLRGEEVDCPWHYPDIDTALRAHLSPGPSAAAIRHSGEEAVRDALRDVFARFEDGAGGYRLENVFRYLVAT